MKVKFVIEEKTFFQDNLIENEHKITQESLAPLLPYLDVIDNQIFFENERAAFVLQLGFLYDDILDNAQILEKESVFENFLNALDPSVSVQFIFKKTKYFDDIINAHYKENESQNPLIHRMFEKRIQKIQDDVQDSKLFRFRLYAVFIKKYNYYNFNIKEFLHNVYSGYSYHKLDAEQKKLFQSICDDLLEIQGKYIAYLKKVGISISIPTENETIDFIASQINRQELHGVHFTTKYDICCELEKKWDYMIINGKYVRIITFKSGGFPEFVDPTIIKHILKADLHFEYDVITNIQVCDKSDEVKGLKRIKNVTRALKVELISGGEDKEKAIKEANIEQLLGQLVSGRENIFKYEFLCVIEGSSLKELNTNCQDMLSSITLISGARAYCEQCANLPLYLTSSLPGTCDFSNNRTTKLWTSIISDLIPYYGPPAGVGEPLMLFRNVYNSLTYFNPLSSLYISKNGIIIGTTGSGKSFVMNLVSLGYMSKDPIILVVDIGGSYKKLIETFGGDYFEISFEYSINPFQGNSANKELFWKTILQSMIRDEAQVGVSNDQKLILEKAIAKVLEKKIDPPIVSDFIDALRELDADEELKDILKIRDQIIRNLLLWTQGAKGKFINQRQSSVNIENRIIGFDLKGLREYPELMEVVMFYIANVVWTKAETYRDQKKLIIFDEVWQQFLTKQGSELLEELYRTLRKYAGSIWSLSQDISDFADSEVSAAILQNISFFYVMKQSDGTNYEKLQHTLNLSPQDISEIMHLQSVKGKYSEAFIKTPELKFVGRITPSPFEYWLATSDGEDITEYKKRLSHNKGDILKTVTELSEEFPQGVFQKK